MTILGTGEKPTPLGPQELVKLQRQHHFALEICMHVEGAVVVKIHGETRFACVGESPQLLSPSASAGVVNPGAVIL